MQLWINLELRRGKCRSSTEESTVCGRGNFISEICFNVHIAMKERSKREKCLSWCYCCVCVCVSVSMCWHTCVCMDKRVCGHVCSQAGKGLITITKSWHWEANLAALILAQPGSEENNRVIKTNTNHTMFCYTPNLRWSLLVISISVCKCEWQSDRYFFGQMTSTEHPQKR